MKRRPAKPRKGASARKKAVIAIEEAVTPRQQKLLKEIFHAAAVSVLGLPPDGAYVRPSFYARKKPR